MTWLLDIGFFALLFFPLVFFHELGHFLMARWMGVKVERFSIGMGPKLFSKVWGDTEYRIALLPLGGYVKMAGDDPTKHYSEEERRQGFLTQTPGPKLLIVLGGPAFNLILPLFIFSFMLMVGIPTVKSVVGTLEEGSPAVRAGLMSGDEVVAVNGQPIRAWSELEEIVKKSPEQDLELEVRRLDVTNLEVQRSKILTRPEWGEGMTRFGETIDVGRVGIGPHFLEPRFYFEGSGSLLEASGVEKFDRVKSINRIEVAGLDQLRRFLNARSAGEELEMRLDRDGATHEVSLLIPEGSGTVTERIGFGPVELVVGEVVEGKAAAAAGLQVGDRLVSIAGKSLSIWDEVPSFIRETEGERFELVWSRDGEIMSATVQAEATTIDDPMLGKDNPLAVEEILRIGVGPLLRADTSFFLKQSYNPIDWVSHSVIETWTLTSLTGQAIWKLVTGQLSLKMLGSPIMIYKVAGNSYRISGGGHQGWMTFLNILALLSITLGLVNLLPIPVLDGGHAVFFSIEALRGKPVSVRAMEIATQFGLIIILGLFAMVLYNDFHRYGFFDRFFQFFQ